MKTDDTSNRTFALPIHFVEDKGFYDSLRFSCKTACATYNRVLTQCMERDKDAFLAYGNRDKVPSFPKQDKDDETSLSFYKIEAGLFPSSTKGHCASVVRSAESKYREKRWEIIKGRSSIPQQRSVPFPILRNDDKTQIWLERDEFGYDHLFVQLKLFNTDGCHTYKCELKSGSNFARQISTLKKMWANPDYDKTKDISGDNNPYISKDKTINDVGDSKIWLDNKGRPTFGLSIKLKKRSSVNKTGILRVFSTKDNLLSCIIDKSPIPFSFNCDNIIRWQSERDRKQQRLRQDKKFDRGLRKAIYKKQADISNKYKNRIKGVCHDISSLIIKKALALNVSKIELDTTIKSYLRSFTWFDLEQKIKYKCEDNGIEFEKVTRAIIEPEITDPHIYFQMAIDIDTNKPLNKVKIGQTGSGKKRKKDLENMGGQKLVYLFGDKQPKTNLTKKEKEYHSLFSQYKLDVGKEWFRLEPILEHIKEWGVLGNMGNIDEINSYLGDDSSSTNNVSRGPVASKTQEALEGDISV